MKLRPYQEAAINTLRGTFRFAKRVLLYSPTGSGKTIVAMEIIRAAVAKGTRVAFVCHRVGLVAQASRCFDRAGIRHGVIQGANTTDSRAQVVVCSIQTLARRGYPPVGLLVIDEAHAVAGSEAYLDLLARYNNVPTVGLSATPFSTGLGREYEWGKPFESIVPAATIRGLIDDGYLVDAEIYAPSEPDLSGVKIVAGEYQQTQLGEAVDKAALIGDIVTHWKRLANGKPTVCFATNIAHSKHICEQFRSEGITAEHIDCYTEDADREAILRRVDAGITTVVCNVAVLAEGWDSPSVEVMICARPTRSLIRWIQMAGRILRPYPGKSLALILDHSGTAARLGFPTDELPLTLDTGKVVKAESVAPEKLPKVCLQCKILKAPGVHECPACGFAPERKNTVETESGELVKISRKSREDKQEIYSGLITIAKARAYSDGWISHTYRDLTGVWPKGLLMEAGEPSTALLGFVQHKLIKFHRGKHAHQPTA